MTINNVIFYNGFSSGDIHVSRSLVRHVVENIPKANFYYVHNNDPDILKDIPNLSYSKGEIPEDMFYLGWQIDRDQVICNTWYNAYATEEFEGCTIQTLFNVFKRGLKEIFQYDLPGEVMDYLPEINFDKTDDISKRILDLIYHTDKRILISNNNVLSGQSDNFNFNRIISSLASTFPSIDFIMTNNVGKNINIPNVHYAGEIIGKNENNLNEVAHLSSFCDIIIGRGSGPYTFSTIKRNLMNEKKTFICFSDIHFGVADYAKAKIIQSNNHEPKNVKEIIIKTIEERMFL